MNTESTGNEHEGATPDVSVIMPAFNAQDHIRESILGVMAQTYRSLELIVTDDASTDSTADIVRELAGKDVRIRLIRNVTNRGVSLSRNRGIENARGRFLMFLDSDDLWEPEKLEVQVSFMLANECAVSYMDYSRFKDTDVNSAWRVAAPERISYEELLASNEIGMLTAAIDLHRVPRLPAFEVQGHEDYLFWLDVLKVIAPRPALKAPSSKTLARYRERNGSVSSDRMKSALWHWNILAQQKQALPSRLVLMARYLWRALRKRKAIHHYCSNSTKSFTVRNDAGR
ncbi:MAG TPA: glycosyltransferase family 2 protein [Gammaproteobacteria bacterium]